MVRGAVVSVIVLGMLLVCMVEAKKYDLNSPVPVYFNTIGPYNNPMEVYRMWSMPFCVTTSRIRKHTSLANVLQGDRPIKAGFYNIKFGVDQENAVLCQRTLTPEHVTTFTNAIAQQYYYEMILDELPIHGFIGYQEYQSDISPSSVRSFLYTHVDFSISKNKNRIVQVNATSYEDRVVELTTAETKSFNFTYSVKWTNTNYPAHKRMDLYKDDFFGKEMEIHWLSIMNSLVLVVLLTGFLAIIVMRILKNDFIRYEKGSEREEGGDTEDYGWKLVHHDVFRFPTHKSLFCAFYGLGCQLLTTALGVILLSLTGLFHPEMAGVVGVAAIVLYALSSGVGGFFATRLFEQMGGVKWAWTIVLTSTAFAVPLALVFMWVNTVAAAKNSTTALPFGTVLEILSIHMFVAMPLYMLGGIAGRRTAGTFYAPCRTANAVREIPPIPWFRTLPFQMALAGFLPFSAIYIEMFYIFAALWGHTYYSLYGILFIVFVILLIVTASITIALTYFQLSLEDHRWWWKSFLCGGSASILVFIYSCYYYWSRSAMSGLLQGSFFFGYTFIACYAFFMLLGTVGFVSSLIFVRCIYAQLKSE